jgi:UDP-N-acetylmuramate dehydrogenase
MILQRPQTDSSTAAAWCRAAAVPHRADAPLGPLTWYGVGGRAQVLAEPVDAGQLTQLVRRGHEAGWPVRVLGAGANLLVPEGVVPGVVVRLDAAGFKRLQIDGPRVRVGAGHDLFKLVSRVAKAGLAGLEPVAGVPATVGGAVRMNAGGGLGDIGSVVHEVRGVSAQGEALTLQRDDLEFGYRTSNLTGLIVTEVELVLEPTEPGPLRERVGKLFEAKRASQPMHEPSSGCVFKNPVDQPAAGGRGAGQLIDEAGLKGTRHGSAWVSERHANFLCLDRHDPAAKAGDVVQLMQQVQARVREHHGVNLQREVVVWGEGGAVS